MNDPHAVQPVLRDGPPLAESRAVMVLLHGRGAGPENILELGRAFDRPDWTVLAPAAFNRTWYPLSFLAAIEENEPYLSSAIKAIDTLVTQILAAGVAPGRIVLGGFSQGACLASEYVYRHPRRYAGLIAFSGGLIGPPGLEWNPQASLDGMPMFFGCSDIDAHVPRFRVDESVRVFTAMKARVTERIYPGMGHLVNDDEIAAAQALLDGAAQ